MTVSTHDDRAALAGSTGINATHPAQDDERSPLVDPGANAGQDGTRKRRGRGPSRPKPGVLVLTCAHCHRAIVGTGAGYAAVNLVDAAKTAQRAAAGYIDPARAVWTVAHRGCLSEPLRPLSGWFVIWCEQIASVDALLDAVLTLSRERWWQWTDWQGLVRRVRADTETAAIPASRYAALAPGDPRHGTVTGYTNHGCRCDECKAAQSERGRLRRGKSGETASPDANHGDRREYLRGCRCDQCKAANNEYNRANREVARAEGLAEGDSRHGTLAGYDWFGCRCDECKAAKSRKHKADYARRIER